MISRSYDGELVARLAKAFGYETVRGSSSQGGVDALLGMKRTLSMGTPVIFTADGPRGPRYRTKAGPIKLAQLTGEPITAFYVLAQRRWTTNSWDRLMIPKPFSRAVISWARPMRVEAELSHEQVEQKRLELEQSLERARHAAEAHFGLSEQN